ncbi:hypothetical protein [Agromyces indicus]|uniref:DUF3592 domain-containing protein n=1 Tax=Agromyces indicus TaxID=758919 RepID=A0ABU1FM73_9MICO|nr:hypothetical protein [Agromyces indicus]MDR5692866.1 hypothetical protein [Agromyces indicus]
MLAFISAVAFGVTLGGAIGAIATGDPRYIVAWSLALPIAIVSAVFAFLRSVGAVGRAAGTGAAPPAGELALARVERIGRTGLTVGGQPQVELLLTVAPRFRAAYTTTHREVVDVVAIPRVQPGEVVVVRRPDDAAPGVVLELDPPPEWARLRDAEQLRTGAERTVPLAEQAPKWEPIESAATSAVSAGRSATAPHRVAWRVLLGGLAVATAAVVLIPAYDAIGRTARAIASGDPSSAGVVLGDRHREIVDALVAETGGTRFASIGFYGEYALASAPSEPGALTIDSYEYRYDRTSHGGPDPIQPDDPEAALFDVGDVDWDRIPALIDAAEEHSGIAEPTGVIVTVSRSPVADATGVLPLRMLVMLDSAYEDAVVPFDATTGELLG